MEEVFVRTGRVLHLHVGGQVIRTTPEHPFYVREKGWVAGGQLQVGELLSTRDGEWVSVKDILDTGEYETVYNLRVQDYHTYFVGSGEWTFSVWAHNADYSVLTPPSDSLIGNINLRLNQWKRGIGDCMSHSYGLWQDLNALGVQAFLRRPTGPGAHEVVLLAKEGVVIDVTADQLLRYAGGNGGAIGQQFFRELNQTGVWTLTEYNQFLRAISSIWHL